MLKREVPPARSRESTDVLVKARVPPAQGRESTDAIQYSFHLQEKIIRSNELVLVSRSVR